MLVDRAVRVEWVSVCTTLPLALVLTKQFSSVW